MYTIEDVAKKIGESKSYFEFRIYKDYNSPVHHTGIVVILDGIRKFSIDFGPEFAEFGSSGSSGGINCLFTQTNPVITCNKPKEGSHIKETGAIQLISLKSRLGRVTAMLIVWNWSKYDHGRYDMTTNNCRHFCQRCIAIASKIENGSINKDQRSSALTMLHFTHTFDLISEIVTLTLPVHILRNVAGPITRAFIEILNSLFGSSSYM